MSIDITLELSYKKTIMHSINALRVIAEFFVVRHHIIPSDVGMDNLFVRDLMSFFFVLSGFVLMCTYFDKEFITRRDVFKFWLLRVKKMYPTYLFCLLCEIPNAVNAVARSSDHCSYLTICPVLQVFMLNSWFGCGIRYITNSPSWYLCVLIWLWIAFPVFKGVIKSFFTEWIWTKIVFVGIVETSLLYAFREYDTWASCTLPLLRAGEFLIGCGAACHLKRQSLDSRQGIARLSVVVSLIYLVAIYILFSLPGVIAYQCPFETIDYTSCGVWQKEVHTLPSMSCRILFDKYFNKHAVLWALIIHYTAWLETSECSGRVMQFLQHDFFKSLSSFSLTLYLSHVQIKSALMWLAGFIGSGTFWTYDILIITTYALCYVLHLGIQRSSRCFDRGEN